MNDPAIGIEHGGNDALATQRGGGAEAAVEIVKMAHAVEHRQDGGSRPHRRRERFYRIGDVIGFAAQHDQVEAFT